MAVLGVILLVLAAAAAAVGFSALGALIVWAIYNNAIAEPFGLQKLDFLQTWGILFLISIVTGFFERSHVVTKGD